MKPLCLALAVALLAREEVKKRKVQVSLLPTIDLKNQGAGLSAAGTF